MPCIQRHYLTVGDNKFGRLHKNHPLSRTNVKEIWKIKNISISIIFERQFILSKASFPSIHVLEVRLKGLNQIAEIPPWHGHLISLYPLAFAKTPPKFALTSWSVSWSPWGEYHPAPAPWQASSCPFFSIRFLPFLFLEKI